MATPTTDNEQRPMTWPEFFVLMIMPIVVALLLVGLFPVEVSHFMHQLNGPDGRLHAATRYDTGILLAIGCISIGIMTFIFWVNTLMREETTNDLDTISSTKHQDRHLADVPPLRGPAASWQGNSYDEFSAFNEKPVTFRQRYRQIREQDKRNGW